MTPSSWSERAARSESDGGNDVSTRSAVSTSSTRHSRGSIARKSPRSVSRASSAIWPAISTPVGPFRYRDKGNLATIGRARAVADLHAIRLSGFLAWVTWLVVHLWYLVGFQNRLIVFTRWAFSFLTRGRGARLITDAARAREPAASPPARG